MNNQNNSLENNSLFNKVKSWFYHFFHKSPIIEPGTSNAITDNTTVSEKEVTTKPKDFFEEYKEKNDRCQYLLNLQRKYKNKEVFEEDMSEEDRIDLENLYIEQNTELKRKIRSLESKIAKS